MGIGNFLKGAANAFLDEYESSAKKLGHNDSENSAKILKDYVNGKIDANGNPIEKNREDEEW